MIAQVLDHLRYVGAAIKKHALSVSVLFLVAFFWFAWQQDKEATVQAELKRQHAFEQRRVTTSDPLLNLAGCMTNHATYAAKLGLADVVHAWNKDKPIDNETAVHFTKVRQMLLDTCPDYWSKAVAVRGSVGGPQLNSALRSVLQSDPEILRMLEQKREVDRELRFIYVK